MDLQKIQKALRDKRIDGWLLCDFRNRDELAYRVLGLDFKKMTSRRWYYYIPAKGEPRKLVSAVERMRLDSLPGKRSVYLSWEELHRSLPAVIDELERRGLGMTELVTHHATLEDLFLHLTGRHLRDA